MTPPIQYYNQTAPFWHFIASLEDQGFSPNTRRGEPSDGETQRPNPWTEGWAGFPFGSFPYRGRNGPAHPPPPPTHDGPPPPPRADNGSDSGAGPSEPRGPPSGPPPDDSHHGRHSSGSEPRHGRCGRGRGGWGGKHCRGSFHPYAGPFGTIADMFQSQLFGGEEGSKEKSNEDFKPEVDVFDTAESFVIHISLAGAKKEDVGVSWDAEKSELSIAGVIHRPGDEEFLKTLALDERKVGVFERKVRLGSRANPAQVDSDGISARMEDGVLRVEVPKLDAGYVEIKKVDIE
ncbi:unnamed protein product [Zymoseptoria tritici ST99CH_3D1]|uniref:SHSP domain-containing protein n=2 Tax=Zymoseptoria tritici TaxID=1047171 RepID=A0A2H1FXK6_ZYMTR|nr:unnamed protein product [Zymoseptoria tritici ST99CH_1E4]SMR47229.1 unnamed protein product [Zymoseptoria tritici ST99CH_3D1]